MLRFRNNDGNEYPEWEEKTIKDCLKYEQPTKYIVSSENYSEEYETPVLTANKKFILGYTSEKEGIYNKGNAIIYDDFTMDIKYVTFSFKVKSSAMKILTPKGKINLYYTFSYLQSLNLHQSEHARSYISKVEPMNMYVPCIEEQQKIADFLSKVDEKIANQEAVISDYKKMKKGLMQKIFSQEVRFKADDGSAYPEWEEKKVKDIFKITRGYVLAVNNTCSKRKKDYQYPVYSSQTKNNGLMGYFNEYLYENAITWTTDGANAGTTVFRKGKFYCTNVCGVLLNDSGNANECMAEMINNISHKYVSYVGNPKLMNNVMAEIKITVPCVKEQQKISDCLSTMDRKIEAEKKILEDWKELKKALLQQMFV